MHSGVRQLTGSMGRFTPPWFSPSRPGCPGTEVSSCCDVSKLYAGSCPALTGRLPLGSFGSSWRSPLMWLLITGLYLKNVYSVVKEHLVRGPRNNSVVTSRILSEKQTFAVGLAGPPGSPRRAIFIWAKNNCRPQLADSKKG